MAALLFFLLSLKDIDLETIYRLTATGFPKLPRKHKNRVRRTIVRMVIVVVPFEPCQRNAAILGISRAVVVRSAITGVKVPLEAKVENNKYLSRLGHLLWEKN